MTVQTETSRSGPYAGAGTTGPFTVGFRFLSGAHLRVIRTSVLGVDTTLVLDTDYTASGAGAASGTVTLTSALAVGEKLTIIRDVPFTQTADYVAGDAFPAESHEDALDLLTMQTQQIKDDLDRSLTLPPTSIGVSTELPAAQASHLIGWDETGGGLTNVPVASLATAVQANTWTVDLFDGDGVETVFALTAGPGNTRAVLCSVNGVVQVPGVNFSVAGTLLTFLTGAPSVGTDNIAVQYGQAVPTVGAADLTNTTGTLPVAAGGTGAATAAGAPFALKGANTDITSLTGLASINGGQLAGLRNRIINGNFGVNQRTYVSGAAVGANLYGHDRWKMAASADTYTFSTTANVTTVTIPASKVLRQVIEGLNLESGTYTLSWSGTAQGKIGAGSYGASGITGVIVGGTNTTIEFGPGTVSKVQLEFGSTATAFEQRPVALELALCQRYFEVLPPVSVMFPWASGTALVRGHHSFVVTKRATPTITMGGKIEGVGTLAPTATTTFGVVYGGTGSIQDVVTYTTNTAASEL